MPQFLRRIGMKGATLGVIVILAHCGGSDLTLPSESRPASISKFDGDEQNGSAGAALLKPLVVRVVDQRGQPVVDQRVAFTAGEDASGARITPAEATTNSDGKAQADWVLGAPSGIQSVVATVVGSQLSVTFQALVESGAPRRIEEAGGNGQDGTVGTPLSNPLVVRVTDQFGNPVKDVLVEWLAEGGSVDPGSSTTGIDGRAQTSWVLGPATGQQTASASAEGLDGTPVGFVATAAPGSADELVLLSGNNQSAAPGQQLDSPLVVRLEDESGNGVPNRAVSWVIGSGGGSVSATTTTTDNNGEAQVYWTLGPTSGLNTLNAVVSGVGFVPFRATAGTGGGGGGGGGSGSTPSGLQFVVQPSDTERKENISPAVQVVILDQNGNRVTGGEFEVNLELLGDDDGKLKGHDRQKTRSGVATFDDIEVDEEGEYRLRASTDGLPSVDSDGFQIHQRDGDGDD